MDFLSEADLRPLTLPDNVLFNPIVLALGEGSYSLGIAVIEASGRPTLASIRRAWTLRLGGRPIQSFLSYYI